ncbi:MaoC family dehydratase [Halostagnicola sp. A-GB9-2]|uniref:MaoC family dehydratase n=1 Tax=Halostagnicola sp. A-GB9-2 TaxID=3048066 RepID=UPI0024C02A9C|nr:MaoC family dehydratase [Halostagnicola sp. A-GB9-2]MDJ1431546.1 MaoC family dehydratase [Halostagnicola sp. A-GB9-2]
MSQQNSGKTDVSAMTDAWSAMTRSFIQTTAAANRAAVSAMVPPIVTDGSDEDGSSRSSSDEPRSNGPTGVEQSADIVSAPIPSVEYSDLDWEFERTTDTPDHISVGDTVTFEKTLSEDDVQAFAHISGDTNRLHLDDDFAAKTRFGKRIVHGTLVSGLISAALARLPGLTIYLSQDLEFQGPVGIGDRVSARVEIVDSLGNDQYRLETLVRDEDADETVVEGEAVVLIDEFPE